MGCVGCFGSAATKEKVRQKRQQEEQNKRINEQIQKDKKLYKATHRLLLLGEFLEAKRIVLWQLCKIPSYNTVERDSCTDVAEHHEFHSVK